MLESMSDRRLLLVHAHPDDESTVTGATMARYAAEGATVTLVTCTSGELGEVVAPELAHLRDSPEALGEHRRRELDGALAEFGDIRQHWLGGPGRWRDSGMAGLTSNSAEGVFAAADPGEVTREVVRLLRAERPHVVITYDDYGGYGHPDHIAANRAVMNALDPAADADWEPQLGEAWTVPKVYWITLPTSFVERMHAAGATDFNPGAVPDAKITAVLDGTAQHSRKLAALRHYRSQVDVDDDGFFARMVRQPEFVQEHFLLVRGERGPGSGPHDQETDLFAGL